MPRPNVGERDARARQLAAGAAILFAANQWTRRPVLALSAAVVAVDLAATAALRWCWMNELLGLDTRALDGAPSMLARRA